MGARAPSFSLCLPLDGVVAADAAIAFAAHGDYHLQRVTVGDRALPTTVTRYVVPFAHPNGDQYGSIRPASGDWPLGTLELHAGSNQVGRERREAVTIVPQRLDAPRCESFGAPELRRSMPMYQMESYEFVAIDHGVVASAQGPFVLCSIDYEVGGERPQLVAAQTLIFVAKPGTVQLSLPLPRRLICVRLTDLAGATLTLTSPFPKGAPPRFALP